MPRRAKNVSQEDRDAVIQLAQNITAVISGILRSKGMTQMALAAATGYARSTLNQVFKSDQADRKWTLKMLVVIAKALDTPLSQLIQMAEAWSDEQQNRDELELSIQTFGTDPQTPERLQAIINGVLNSNTDTEDVSLFQIGCPKIYKDFLSGDISDLEAYDALVRANNNRGTTSTGTPLPLWAATAQSYK